MAVALLALEPVHAHSAPAYSANPWPSFVYSAAADETSAVVAYAAAVRSPHCPDD